MKICSTVVSLVFGLVFFTGSAHAQNFWVERGDIGPDDTIHLAWVHGTAHTLWLWTLSNDGSNVLSDVVYAPPAQSNICWFSDIYVRSNNTIAATWDTTNSFVVYNLTSSNTWIRRDDYPKPDGWWPGAVLLGYDDKLRVLWTRSADNALAIWTLDTNGNIVASAGVFVPPTGWSVADEGWNADIGPDGNVRVVWSNTGGDVSIWSINSTGAVVSSVFWAAPSGWSCTNEDISVGSDNKMRIFWEHPSDGAVSLWVVGTDGTNVETSAFWLPPSGWHFEGGGVLGSSNNVGMAWVSSTQASLWKLNSALTPVSSLLVDLTEPWEVRSAELDSANKLHLLWANSSGVCSLWRMDTGWTNVEAVATYGPY